MYLAGCLWNSYQATLFFSATDPSKNITKSQPNIHKTNRGAEITKILHYCNNLTHLCLPVLDHSGSLNDPDDQLREAVTENEIFGGLKSILL